MPIHYEQGDDHIVMITIDRPEAKNSADMEHFKQLREAWERFGADADSWVAIITGVGDAFFTRADPAPPAHRLDDGTRAVLRNVELWKPIVAAVNGFCTAGGMEMLGGVDIRVACPEAQFAVMRSEEHTSELQS